jgi:hypothetical protein
MINFKFAARTNIIPYTLTQLNFETMELIETTIPIPDIISKNPTFELSGSPQLLTFSSAPTQTGVDADGFPIYDLSTIETKSYYLFQFLDMVTEMPRKSISVMVLRDFGDGTGLVLALCCLNDDGTSDYFDKLQLDWIDKKLIEIVDLSELVGVEKFINIA